MNFQNLHKVAIGVVSAGLCAYATIPEPTIEIEPYDDTTNETTLVRIKPGFWCANVKTTYINLEYLEAAYIVSTLFNKDWRNESMLIITQYGLTPRNFKDDCRVCQVATEIEYVTLFGPRKKMIVWVPEKEACAEQTSREELQ